MDSNIITILVYIGILLLVGVAKSIGRAGKNKNKPAAQPEVRRLLTPEQDAPPQFSSQQRDNSVVNRAEKSAGNINAVAERNMMAGDFYKEINAPANAPSHEGGEKEFVLEEFDLRSAIIYSEIFRRPDY